MLDKKKRNRPIAAGTDAVGQTPIATVIGSGSDFEGTLQCEGALRIDGKVRGSVNCGETIIIGETGYVEADLNATVVVIAGELHGNVHATEMVELLPSGKLYGDAVALRIALSEGAFVRGRCETCPPGEASPGPSFLPDSDNDDMSEPILS